MQPLNVPPPVPGPELGGLLRPRPMVPNLTAGPGLSAQAARAASGAIQQTGALLGSTLRFGVSTALAVGLPLLILGKGVDMITGGALSGRKQG